MKYSNPTSKLSGTKFPGENVGPNCRIRPSIKVPQFSFNLESVSPMGGPSHSRPPDPIASNKPDVSSPSPIHVVPLGNEEVKFNLGIQPTRAQEGKDVVMIDHSGEINEEAFPATPHPPTC